MALREELWPWESVPQGHSGLNNRHRLYKRLVGGCCPGAEIDWRGKPVTGVRTRDSSLLGPSALGSTTGYVSGSPQSGLVGRNSGGTSSTHHYTVLVLAQDVGDGYILDDAGIARNSIKVASGNFYMAAATTDMFAAAGATVPSSGLVRIAAYSGQYLGAQPTVRINGTTYTGSNSNQDSWAVPAGVSWFGSSYYPSANRFVGHGLFAWIFSGALTAEDIDSFFEAPWEFFEPRRVDVPASAGGSSWSVSLTESTTTSDAATAAYIAAASVAESITAADSLAAATTWVLSLTEAATAAESITTAGTFAASITEAASTSDALTSAVTWARALTEAASASDLATAVIHAVAALTEAATASDSQTTGSIYTGSVTESASVADALTAAATLVALLTEVATTSDAASSAATWVRLLTEPATAVDSVAGAQGATYTASVTEVLAAAELLVAVLAAQGVISAPPLGHGIGMSRRVTQAGRSRPANLNSRTR